MTSRRSITALLTAWVLGLCLSPSAFAAGGPGPFSAQPSAAAPQDKAGTFFRLHVEPGTTRRQSVVVKNLSDNPKHLLLDAVDGRTGTTSGSVYPNREDPVRAAGAWLDLTRRDVTIPPRREMRIPFSIDVPASARTGDHLAGISVQDARRTKSDSTLAVTQVVRVVVGVQIIVDGPREPALTVRGVDLQALPGTKVPSVVVRLENTGTKLCKPTVDVNLAGAAAAQSSASKRLDTVLPGEAIDYPLQWPTALEAGTYEVAVQTKDCGEPQAVRAEAELGQPLQGTQQDPSATAPAVIVKSAGLSWPAAIGLLIAVAALGAIFTALFLRRRRTS